MNLNDFLFSYRTIIKRDLYKKNYLKLVRKIFNYPYKYILNLTRNIFLIKKINLDKKYFYTGYENFNLDKLFMMFNSDKGSKVNWAGKIIKGHNYSHLYEKYLSKFKKIKKLNILEIGSLKGSSAASFLLYFDNPRICCLDINPFQIRYFSKNIRNIFVDTQSKKILNCVAKYLDCEFDIIIDDASHNKRDQIITLNTFLPKLKQNGIYIVEDTCEFIKHPHLNSDHLNYGINEFLMSVNETGNHVCNFLSESEKMNIKTNIGCINYEKGNFIHNNVNIPEIIFIEKI
jgi:hypothetical protein